MVHLPTTFFRRLNSVIYQFVWHNCKPKIKYTQLCLDPKLDGLGLLDPQIQRHNLQIRLLRQVLEDNHPQSCSQPILLNHIRHFHSGNTGTRLALFFPLLQLCPAAHVNNFMQNIYEAVDSFGYVDTEQAKCTPATLLRLPLSAIFAMIPTDYWITRSRHKKLKVSQFFTYDHHFGCIRPLLSSDQPSSPRLVSKLSRDIHNRIIKLNQLIWPHILNQNQPFGEVDDSAFIYAFCLQPNGSITNLNHFGCLSYSDLYHHRHCHKYQPPSGHFFGQCLFRLKVGLYGIVYSTVNSIANHFFQDLITV
ncbi:hypothetical protein G6F37_005815 [Rhizopus arrhizus]|nr:hypothetical protein G6F38_005910 [Rhizopus arrhizus]KAG1158411.1 hypothetical protein G6F37_005815 [Rhizopus arrhizus]